MDDINIMENISSWSWTLCETPIQSVQLGAVGRLYQLAARQLLLCAWNKQKQ